MSVLSNLFLGVDKIAAKLSSFSLYIAFKRIGLLLNFIFKQEVKADINGVELTITTAGDIILKTKGKYIDIDSDLIFISCDDDNKMGKAIYNLKEHRDVKTIESGRPGALSLFMRRETLRGRDYY